MRTRFVKPLINTRLDVHVSMTMGAAFAACLHHAHADQSRPITALLTSNRHA
jgi:hypothetical protein